MSETAVQAEAAPGFGAVVDAFRDSLALERSGAALSVWVDGTEVVDVRAGIADDRTGRPWTADIASVLFSVSKGLGALVVGMLRDDGLLDLDAPVASLWPEFAAEGKGSVTIGDALAHRAGLSAPPVDLGLDDVRDSRTWAAALAAQRPLWTPGRGHAYHALSYGPIVEEIVRRATGRELHELFRDRIALPLGADVSLRPDADLLARTAHLVPSPAWEELGRLGAPADPVVRAHTLGGLLPPTLIAPESGFNDPAVRAIGLTAGGAIGTASGLARIWSAAVTPTAGLRLLSDATIAALTRVRSAGPWVFPVPAPYPAWGAGVQLPSDAMPAISPASFGHGGAGGQFGMADPAARVGVGYLRNRLDVVDPMPGILDAIRRIVLG